MKEQLSTLKLLLDFMRTLHTEYSNDTFESEQSPMDIAKVQKYQENATLIFLM